MQNRPALGAFRLLLGIGLRDLDRLQARARPREQRRREAAATPLRTRQKHRPPGRSAPRQPAPRPPARHLRRLATPVARLRRPLHSSGPSMRPRIPPRGATRGGAARRTQTSLGRQHAQSRAPCNAEAGTAPPERPGDPVRDTPSSLVGAARARRGARVRNNPPGPRRRQTEALRKGARPRPLPPWRRSATPRGTSDAAAVGCSVSLQAVTRAVWRAQARGVRTYIQPGGSKTFSRASLPRPRASCCAAGARQNTAPRDAVQSKRTHGSVCTPPPSQPPPRGASHSRWEELSDARFRVGM